MTIKLLVADLHLTANPQDDYRWKIFEEIEKNIFKYRVEELIILGDLTDKKDNHNSFLINGICDHLLKTLYFLKKIIILKGNHDYIDSANPYFKFLSNIINIKFVCTPEIIGNCLYIPHTHNPTKEYFKQCSIQNIDYIFLHQPFLGAKIHQKYELKECIDAKEIFKDYKQGRIFSGDIHIPQTLGNIEYVGAPYPIHFGDEYKSRFILLQDNKDFISIPVKTINRYFFKLTNIYELQNLTVKENDQVCVRLEIGREDYSKIDTLKTQIREFFISKKVEVFSVEITKEKEEKALKQKEDKQENKDWLSDFCKTEKLNISYKEYAEEISQC